MARYATPADLATVVPAGVLTMPADAQQKALDDASAEADTYIRNQYTLPLSQPYDPTLVRKVCQLAAWQLVGFKGRKVEAGKVDVYELMQADALVWLGKLATKRVSLGAQADASPGISRGAARVASRPPRGYPRRS